ncbi:MAG: SLBB domain-containing protein [Pygmaiobacter massiliensis]|nr:SLBB domain-containing protein [Pygmaiobacter massiliensis]
MGLLEQIKAAGIVGCGGAGFPTHVKLDCKADWYLINAAECEPLLRTDRWLMKHKADEVVAGAKLAAKQVGAKRCVFALKETYTEEIASLEAAIKKAKSSAEIYKMKNYYPAGDEQMITCDITGKTVPPAGIPRDAGAVVSNLTTVYEIGQAAKGIPFTMKYLTVTGEVAHPTVLCVPLGTPFAQCIEAAGGLTRPDCRIIAGGPLMGKQYTLEQMEDLYVTKTTSGILAIPEDAPVITEKEVPLRSILRRAKTSCIQCERCTELCPRYLSGHPLQPHKIMRKLAYADGIEEVLQDESILNAQLCSECGVCETYACPMGLAPRQVNQYVKGELAKAKLRYQKKDEEYHARPERSYRRAPSKRIATRLGVAQYYDYKIDDCATLNPAEVHLALRQHIGAACVPVVKTGDQVEAGQLIAQSPEGGLGTSLCASISGTVTVCENEIVIRGGDKA